MLFPYNIKVAKVTENSLIGLHSPQFQYACTPEHKMFQVVSRKIHNNQQTACAEAYLEALKGYIFNLKAPAGIFLLETKEALAVNEAFFCQVGMLNASKIVFRANNQQEQEFLELLKTEGEVCAVAELIANGIKLPHIIMSATLVKLPFLSLIVWVLEPTHFPTPS